MLIEIDGSYVTAEYTVDSALLSSCKKAQQVMLKAPFSFRGYFFQLLPRGKRGEKFLTEIELARSQNQQQRWNERRIGPSPDR